MKRERKKTTYREKLLEKPIRGYIYPLMSIEATNQKCPFMCHEERYMVLCKKAVSVKLLTVTNESLHVISISVATENSV